MGLVNMPWMARTSPELVQNLLNFSFILLWWDLDIEAASRCFFLWLFLVHLLLLLSHFNVKQMWPLHIPWLCRTWPAVANCCLNSIDIRILSTNMIEYFVFQIIAIHPDLSVMMTWGKWGHIYIYLWVCQWTSSSIVWIIACHMFGAKPLLTHWGRDKMAAVSQTTLSNAFSLIKFVSIKISLKFVPKGRINNNSALVQIMAWRRSGAKPLSEPMMVSLLTHICITLPQWVKINDNLLSIYDQGTNYNEIPI